MKVTITYTQSETNLDLFARAVHDVERVNIDLERDDYIPNVGLSGIGVVRESVRRLGASLPEVYRFLPFHSVLLTKPLQLLWKAINPEISNEKWRSLLGTSLAFTNSASGFDNHQHADYVNRLDLDKTPPSFDQSRYCGGARFKITKAGTNAMIDSIIGYDNLPAPEELLASPHLWFYGTSISPKGQIFYMRKMGIDGTLKKIRIPLFTSKAIYLPMSELHILNTGEVVEPTTIVYRG